MRQKTILVTGGAGFIGAHLCETLLTQNHRVISLDNFSTGKKDNIKHLLHNTNFTSITHDVVSPFPHISDKIDQIYNLASPASPEKYQKEPIFTLKTNLLGTINVIDCAILHSAKIVHASTSEIYGEPLEHPQKESYFGNVNTVGPRSCYDEGKRAAETLLYTHVQQKLIDVTIVRIFNTYGPKMAADDGRVVTSFIIKALNNKPLRISGDGLQTRSLCFVSDTVDGLIKAMDKNDFFGPVNIGSTEEITILHLAHTIINLTNSSSKIEFYPRPENDPLRRKPDITLAHHELGWHSDIALKDGLEQTIRWIVLTMSSIKTHQSQ